MPGRTWDDYYWPGTDVLANKLGITNPAELRQRESQRTLLAAKDLLRQQPPETYDLDRLLQTHQFLFGSVYDWAGQPREDAIEDAPMYKSYEDVIHYQLGDPRAAEVYYEYPEPSLMLPLARVYFDQLAQQDYLTSQPDRNHFVDRLAYYWSGINTAHLFREGNTRTQTVFFTQLAMNAGYRLDHPRLSYGGELREVFIGARFHAQATDDPSRLADVLHQVVRVSNYADPRELAAQHEQMREHQARMTQWVHPSMMPTHPVATVAAQERPGRERGIHH